jgi:hypothetical protein
MLKPGDRVDDPAGPAAIDKPRDPIGRRPLRSGPNPSIEGISMESDMERRGDRRERRHRGRRRQPLLSGSDAESPVRGRSATTGLAAPGKGQAHYYSLMVDGDMNENAVWYYPEPSEAAQQIKGRVAFWKGVKVS